jgi:hypothetical protein
MFRRVFTPLVIKTIQELADQGKTASEIAQAIGSTAASVRVRCCQLKISLSRRGRPSLVPRLPRQPERQELVVHIGQVDYAGLKRKAAQMDKSPVELAELLVQAVVSANLYEAVLDDPE